jgi:hypothetical protein
MPEVGCQQEFARQLPTGMALSGRQPRPCASNIGRIIQASGVVGKGATIGGISHYRRAQHVISTEKRWMSQFGTPTCPNFLPNLKDREWAPLPFFLKS